MLLHRNDAFEGTEHGTVCDQDHGIYGQKPTHGLGKELCKCPICKEEFPRKDLVNVYGEGKAKHNDRVECPNCSREGLLKTRRNHMEQYGQILLLQNIDEEVSVARRFKWAVYSKYEYRTCTLDETIRIMMYRPHGYKIYYSQDGEYQNWYTGLYIPEWNDSNPCNKRVKECSLYPDGISEALKGTDYESLTRAFEAMANDNINIRMISTSEIKISMLIDLKYAELSVRTLHAAYELDK